MWRKSRRFITYFCWWCLPLLVTSSGTSSRPKLLLTDTACSFIGHLCLGGFFLNFQKLWKNLKKTETSFHWSSRNTIFTKQRSNLKQVSFVVHIVCILLHSYSLTLQFFYYYCRWPSHQANPHYVSTINNKWGIRQRHGWTTGILSRDSQFCL